MLVVVLSCLALRTGGFAAAALARNLPVGVPLLYAVPLAGIAIGMVAVFVERMPASLTRRAAGSARLAAGAA